MKNPSLKKLISSKVFIASDHAGFSLKQVVIEEFSKIGLHIIDLGCDSSTESVDYPDYANKLCNEITKENNNIGILICGSGIGISIAANRFRYIRAALCHDAKTAELSRSHNDANVFCCGARIISPEVAIEAIEAFLNTDFQVEGRHGRRIAKLS